MYILRIYATDAIQITRKTTHATWRQAQRSLYDYERRNGRRPHVIDRDAKAQAQ